MKNEREILKVTKPLAKVFPEIRTQRWGEYGFHEENYRQQFLNDEDDITFIEIVDEMKIKPYLSDHCYYLDKVQADIERENIKQARTRREKMEKILYEIHSKVR